MTPVGPGRSVPTRLLAGGLGALVRAQAGGLPADQRRALLEAARLDLRPNERASEAAVDGLRAQLSTSTDTIRVMDFGAGTRTSAFTSEVRPDERRVAEIYARAAATPAWGRFLFRLVRAFKPRRVLELGTNLGVSAAHLATALNLNQGERGRLVTLEGDPELARRARRDLDGLGGVLDPEAVSVVTGRFDDTLGEVLGARESYDLVFLDGHHEEAATQRYFARIAPHLAVGALVVFDDVEPGRPVRRAWKSIQRAHPEAGAVYLGKLGLLFLAERLRRLARRLPGASRAGSP